MSRQPGAGKYIIPESDITVSYGHAKQIALSNTITALIWNVYKGKKASFSQQYKSFVQDMDLVLIQEFMSSDTVLQTVTNTNMQYDVATSFIYRSSNERTGVATGSVANAQLIKAAITEDREPFFNTPKAVLLTTYSIKEEHEQLLVVNIHGRNRGGLKPFERQLIQIKDSMQSHKGPILFAGDFNTNNKKKYEYLQTYIQELGLREVKFSPDYRTVSGLTRYALDYVFIKGMKVIEAKVVRDSSGSDHNAMQVIVEIDNNAKLKVVDKDDDDASDKTEPTSSENSWSAWSLVSGAVVLIGSVFAKKIS